jgi:hypothetical protein
MANLGAHFPTNDSQLAHTTDSPGDASDNSSGIKNGPAEFENIASPNNEKDAPYNPDTDEMIELTEADCYEELGFCFPTWKKWTILTLIFWVQVSMNFNTSLYSNATKGISQEFGVSMQAARIGAAIFLVTYAFGCELWAPW